MDHFLFRPFESLFANLTITKSTAFTMLLFWWTNHNVKRIFFCAQNIPPKLIGNLAIFTHPTYLINQKSSRRLKEN